MSTASIDAILEAQPKLAPWEKTARAELSRFRAKFLLQQKGLSRELVTIMTDYHRDVVSLVNKFYTAPGVQLTTAQSAVMQTRLRTLVHKYSGNLRNYTQSAILSTAELTALRESQLFASTLAVGLPSSLQAAFVNPFTTNQLAKATHNILWDTALGNRVSLSKKLWLLGEHAQDRVSHIVRTGMQAGLHPVQLAKALEAELVPTLAGRAGPVWSGTRGPERLRGLVRSAPAGLQTRRGTVAYNYLRIARTETFRAQRGAHLLRLNFFKQLPGKINPVVGVQWNLSTSHEIQDICDEWATDDANDLGPGVFPPDALPLGHPNDLCFTTTVMIPPKRFQQNLRKFMLQKNLNEKDLAKVVSTHAGSYLSIGTRAAVTRLSGQLKNAPITIDAIVQAARLGTNPLKVPKQITKGPGVISKGTIGRVPTTPVRAQPPSGLPPALDAKVQANILKLKAKLKLKTDAAKAAAEKKAQLDAVFAKAKLDAAAQKAKADAAAKVARQKAAAEKVKADALAAEKAQKAAKADVLDASKFTIEGPQSGSNPGAFFKDPKTGDVWYIKTPAHEELARNEVLAARLYKEMGVKVPEVRLAVLNGKPSVASKVAKHRPVANKEAITKAGSGTTKPKPTGIYEGFAPDAYLANWDVVGLEYDNLLVGAGNQAWRIDTGGALRFRAQGAAKGDAFGNNVIEFSTLIGGKNPQSAAVFKDITYEEMHTSMVRVIGLKDDTIKKLVAKYGPLDQAERTKLIDTLIARRDFVRDVFNRDNAMGRALYKQLPSKRVQGAGIPKPPHETWGSQPAGFAKGTSDDEWRAIVKAWTDKKLVVEDLRNLTAGDRMDLLTHLQKFKPGGLAAKAKKAKTTPLEMLGAGYKSQGVAQEIDRAGFKKFLGQVEGAMKSKNEGRINPLGWQGGSQNISFKQAMSQWLRGGSLKGEFTYADMELLNFYSGGKGPGRFKIITNAKFISLQKRKEATLQFLGQKPIGLTDLPARNPQVWGSDKSWESAAKFWLNGTGSPPSISAAKEVDLVNKLGSYGGRDWFATKGKAQSAVVKKKKAWKFKDDEQRKWSNPLEKTRDEEWVTLPHNEQLAMKTYTGSDYRDINGKLRVRGKSGTTFDEAILDPRWGDTIRDAQAAILKAPKFDEAQYVWRGEKTSVFGGEKNAVAWYTDRIGTVQEMKGFTSTSYSAGTADAFGDAKVLLEIKTKKGLRIDGNSALSSENELTLAHGTKFRIVDVIQDVEFFGTGIGRTHRTIIQIEVL